MNWLVADWNGNKAHVFEGVTTSLEAFGHSCTSIPRNDMDRRRDLIDGITDGRFDALLTWQRIYPMQRDLLEAVGNSAIRTVYMDFGFTPHYHSVVFDAQGENATSSWPEIWRSRLGDREPDPDFLNRAERMIRSRTAAARAMGLPDIPALSGMRMPFIFIPLQRPDDSVVRYDSKVHDFGALVRRVLLLARGRFFVVVKTHPLDRDLDLGVPDHIAGNHLVLRQNHGDLNEPLCDFLLSRAALVAGINSNMLFRALVFGTPVIAAGRGWFSGSGAFTEVDGIEGLNDLSTSLPDLEAQKRYLAMCLSRQLLLEELSDPQSCAGVFRRIGVPIEGPGVTA